MLRWIPAAFAMAVWLLFVVSASAADEPALEKGKTAPAAKADHGHAHGGDHAGPSGHGGDTAGHGHGDGHEEEGGLLSFNLDLGVWTLVVFLLLLVILKQLAWKPMLEGLKKREDSIRSALEEAQKAREEAEQLRLKLQKEMDHAAETVRAILEEARRDAQHTSEQMLAKAREEINLERERLQRELTIAKDQALQELWNQAADLATLISAKAIRRNLTPEDHRRLMDEALADLRQVSRFGSNDLSGIL
ncbi:MAG: F0F1 ATP synthase subunit B [Gemmatales bacterium]|nr:F0F1 ATP synthase subunit B [Gemmatales bacterium]MDW8386962.1 F0F1 ATP synthase subunit B [Gemmatales bacterium]